MGWWALGEVCNRGAGKVGPASLESLPALTRRPFQSPQPGSLGTGQEERGLNVSPPAGVFFDNLPLQHSGH